MRKYSNENKLFNMKIKNYEKIVQEIILKKVFTRDK